MSPFKTNTPKDYAKQTVYEKGKNSSKPKTPKKKSEKDIIESIRNLFKLKKENEAIKDNN